MNTKNARPFHVQGRCLTVLTRRERDRITLILLANGREDLARKVAKARRI